MRINKEKLNELLSKSDDDLWREIVSVAAKHGYKLPSATPPHSDLEKLRSTVSGPKINVSDALKLLNSYKTKN